VTRQAQCFDYVHAEIKRALAEDAAIAELGIEVVARGRQFVLRGHVESPNRREAVQRLVCDRVGEYRVVNQIVVLGVDPPERAEKLT
jgi:osmotically-inducible protein OsmY